LSRGSNGFFTQSLALYCSGPWDWGDPAFAALREAKRINSYKMENFIAVVLAIVVLGGILWIAKQFLKPVKGPLPDCYRGRGNRDIEV
jgi:hypothetical protein